MPALTHGRVKNGFNGYATRVGLSNTQPIKYNGGQKPKRNFKAEYNAQINAPNALTNSIGSSFTTKRANARRAGDPNRKLLGLPDVSWSAPGQASKKRKVPLNTPNKKSGCPYCPGGNPVAPLIGTEFEGNLALWFDTGLLSVVLQNCAKGLDPGFPEQVGENISPQCVPSGMMNYFVYDGDDEINFLMSGMNNYPAVQFPRKVRISIDNTPPFDGTSYTVVTAPAPNEPVMTYQNNPIVNGIAGITGALGGSIYTGLTSVTVDGAAPAAGEWGFGGPAADNVLAVGNKVKIEFLTP